jgi:hypothetical protein
MSQDVARSLASRTAECFPTITGITGFSKFASERSRARIDPSDDENRRARARDRVLEDDGIICDEEKATFGIRLCSMRGKNEAGRIGRKERTVSDRMVDSRFVVEGLVRRARPFGLRCSKGGAICLESRDGRLDIDLVNDESCRKTYMERQR